MAPDVASRGGPVNIHEGRQTHYVGHRSAIGPLVDKRIMFVLPYAAKWHDVEKPE